MSVYVDRLKSGDLVKAWWPSAPRCFRRDGACHMWADTLGELTAFARRLGLKRAWFQDDPRLPHFDLTGPRRREAIRLGALERSPKDFLRAVGARDQLTTKGGHMAETENAPDAPAQEQPTPTDAPAAGDAPGGEG